MQKTFTQLKTCVKASSPEQHWLDRAAAREAATGHVRLGYPDFVVDAEQLLSIRSDIDLMALNNCTVRIHSTLTHKAP